MNCKLDKADHYIERVSDLPPAPTVAVELLGLFANPDYDIDRVVELISHDPALTVAVLKRCNSAALKGSEIATDMFEAVTRLGFYEVHCLVASLVGARAMAVGKNKTILDTGHLWRHSVVTAVASAALARRVQETETTAFTAGLLHDVGKLVLASVESVPYATMIGQWGTSGPKLAEAEMSTFGVNHASIGARLLTRWGVPANVAGAAMHHHGSQNFDEPFAQLAATVGLASDLAHQISGQSTQKPDWLASRPDAVVFFELTTDDIPVLMQQTERDLRKVQGLLHMPV
jgi:putative nucleotidyltransferase with HDIG domain